MAAIDRVTRERRVAFVLGRPRLLRDRLNPLEIFSSEEVFSRFRFRPETILYIVGLVNHFLGTYTSRRNMPLPPLMQVLVTLRYYATGTFQIVIGDTFGVSQSTVSRCVKRVGRAICSLAGRFIRFPQGEAAAGVKQAFAKIAGFPNVLGCVDGTLIRIEKPKTNEADYVSRKGFHSLNVQMICDTSLRITSLTAKWPGSTHDARIWRDCGLRAQFDDGTHNGLILGDSGYPCRRYLMTPYFHPATPAQHRFNGSLCRTRVLIEQAFGVMKRRFAILHFGLRCSPENAVITTTSCTVLHNIGIDRNDILNVEFDQADDQNVTHNFQAGVEDGFHVRNQIAEAFFG